MHRVVITGTGIVSVLGCTREEAASALYHGRSGIVAEPERLAFGMRSCLTGSVRNFDPARHLSRKQRKTMPDCAVQAHAAVMDAMAQSVLPEEILRSDRCGLVFGNDSSVIPALDQARALEEAGSTEGMGSGHVFRCMNSSVTMNLNILLGNRGAGWTVAAACASGAYALGQATDAVRLGRMDAMICGAAQEIGPQAVAAFDGLGAFSTHPVPEEASRPFDADRQGLVPSGGAAALVLESYVSARRRGATILGEILGFGCSADGESLVVPNATGLAAAMRMALSEARLLPSDITLVNAHATSTPLGDAAEAANLRAVFGDSCPPVMALKSLTGHELWMSGAAQVVYTVLMAERGFTAGTRNFHCGGGGTEGIPVLDRTLDIPPRTVVCNAAGFGGSNAVLVVRMGCPA
ncbi:MAG: beta-ketoacyl-[acyl-carrier-protein] synthase family protein [Desulfovibrio sp.]|jgi:3-oxoacyl-[acyl-carrier-protein] synthase-1|nr:beta-ketoacyl-[acyl-carrier-protein] synthase family protein [Desulfovibrio sp.]